MTTINDIAKLAGVSRTTVSRFLNSNGYVGQEARERIEQVIQETGYMPSQSAKSLRTKKTGVIGIILPKISTETSSRVVSGINDVMKKKGMQILLTDTELDPDKEIEYLRLLKSRQADGIILLATNISERLQKEIDAIPIPVVALGQDVPGIPSLTYADYDASSDMMQLLIGKGHERIGFIGVSNTDPAVGGIRQKAYKEMMQKHGFEVREGWIAEGDFSIESGYEAMKQIITSDRTEVPTAIFCVTDRMATGAMEYLKEQGFRIPEDIAVAGIGDAVMSRYITPSLTTVDYFNEEAGEATAEMLLATMEGKNYNKKNMHKYRLIKRDSV
ncbi:LacI family DNA-binding transcriptional regulator [Salimicrobium halophilum]|uniref:Transcriptional regulator, LacI family n=1 Tax=Salimicrobium halophilum TaxID=86666 RepID=A0A1G8S510_9BACI|nr:LacI family DNA-binding transcriptional regulator [Salimicrobium halophilum]SDJ23740.1 transcriptional regulator, LacI family [Salimicrobium halophilum]